MKVYVKVYVKKSTDRGGLTEYVVRAKSKDGDVALCSCAGKWEAEFVAQCVAEAVVNRTRTVRLEHIGEELVEYLGPIVRPR